MRMLKGAALTVTAVIVMHLLHEGGHALAAKLLGYDVIATVNRVSLEDAVTVSAWHDITIKLAGPVVTILLAALGLKWSAGTDPSKTRLGATMVFVALAMRLLASAVSLNSPNDEAAAGTAMGIGYWTLPLIVVALLGWMMWRAHRMAGLDWRFYLGAWLGASIGFSAVVLGEPYLPSLRF